MIWVLVFLFAADLVMTGLIWRDVRREKGKPKLSQIPSFTKDGHCAQCGGELTDTALEVHALTPLAIGKYLPVTFKICERCVEDS